MFKLLIFLKSISKWVQLGVNLINFFKFYKMLTIVGLSQWFIQKSLSASHSLGKIESFLTFPSSIELIFIELRNLVVLDLRNLVSLIYKDLILVHLNLVLLKILVWKYWGFRGKAPDINNLIDQRKLHFPEPLKLNFIGQINLQMSWFSLDLHFP